MMKPDNRQNATEEALKTMGILDALEPLEVRLQFRVRLMERIERESLTGRLNHAGSGALINYRFAFIVLLIICQCKLSARRLLQYHRAKRTALQRPADNHKRRLFQPHIRILRTAGCLQPQY